jgi:hypothetical protein
MAADAASQFQKIQIQREDTVTTPPSLHPHLFSCLSDSPLSAADPFDLLGHGGGELSNRIS